MTGDRKPKPGNTNATAQAEQPALGEPILSADERASVLSSFEPTPADRVRVRDAMRLALASGSVSKTAQAVDSSMATRASQLAGITAMHGLRLKLAASALVLCGALAGANVWLSRQAAPNTDAPSTASQSSVTEPGNVAPAAKPQPVVVAPESSTTATPARSVSRHIPRASTNTKHKSAGAPLEFAPEPVDETELAAAPVPAPTPSVTTPAFDLADELWLLREASSALTRHDASKADEWLDKYTRRFPTGALEKEARALRVMVACEQKAPRASQARERFLQTEAASPLAERVRQACAKLP